ncbi:hypothetical protein P691DRAFT_422036 [Macrolepiota fuliginosa MF-IS2]|uniref:Uncharacterized protein n=1 Tax=Macrolepiota fuliginosa MF-IS2 TaxID=1400762 RepID=A0A9P5X3C1_9AGAR|nr:hypothetical protein P691DRAFT_422036 [Macrolepiota fuliginosa MF-IS2]
MSQTKKQTRVNGTNSTKKSPKATTSGFDVLSSYFWSLLVLCVAIYAYLVRSLSGPGTTMSLSTYLATKTLN